MSVDTTGGSEPSEQRLRAFVAVPFEDEVRNRLSQARADLQGEAWAEEVRWVKPEALHLTLRFLGNIEASDVDALLSRLQSSMRSESEFSFELSGLGFFPSASRPRVVAARVTRERRLGVLASAVEEAVVSAGYPAETRDFRPHVTLGRFRRGRRRGLELAADLPRVSVAVSHVVLLRSTLSQAGARYTELGRANLANTPGSR